MQGSQHRRPPLAATLPGRVHVHPPPGGRNRRLVSAGVLRTGRPLAGQERATGSPRPPHRCHALALSSFAPIRRLDRRVGLTRRRHRPPGCTYRRYVKLQPPPVAYGAERNPFPPPTRRYACHGACNGARPAPRRRLACPGLVPAGPAANLVSASPASASRRPPSRPP